jgi:hypothetical protein
MGCRSGPPIGRTRPVASSDLWASWHYHASRDFDRPVDNRPNGLRNTSIYTAGEKLAGKERPTFVSKRQDDHSGRCAGAIFEIGGFRADLFERAGSRPIYNPAGREFRARAKRPRPFELVWPN